MNPTETACKQNGLLNLRYEVELTETPFATNLFRPDLSVRTCIISPDLHRAFAENAPLGFSCTLLFPLQTKNSLEREDTVRLHNNRRWNCNRSGFTILELLTVSGIMSILMGLLLPAMNSAREAARQVQCANNLHQLGIALHRFHNVWGGLPPGWQRSELNRSAWGWATAILPFLEESSLESRISFSEPITSARNALARTHLLPVMLCPSDTAEPMFSLFQEVGVHEAGGQDSARVIIQLPSTNYLGVFGTQDPDDVAGDQGNGSFLESRSVSFRELRRGLSQTLLLGERTARKLPSTWFGFHLDGEDVPGRVVGFADKGPNHADADECEFDSRHPGKSHFLWADGHVTSILESIDSATYRSLSTRAVNPY